MKKISPELLRDSIQCAMTLFCIWVGYRFYLFYQWMIGNSDVAVTKPGAVEGFLPISSLLSLKQLFTKGIFDEVHPAGLTIFIAVLVMSLIMRKGFCGYLCPVGFIHNLLNKIGRKIGKTVTVKGKIEFGMLIPKYIALAFFVITVFKMGGRELQAFIRSPYNFTAEAKMMLFFTDMSITAALVVGTILALGIFIPYFWCRFLCPYGALLGILAKVSPIAIKREEDKCISCGKCNKACPGGIEVDRKQTINSPECVGCTQCINACPVDGCLNVTDRLSRVKLPWYVIAAGSLVILLVYYAAAKFTNHWDSPYPLEMLRKYYMMM
ncbi:4Fe-4S binding protein [Maridesulfovibrio salexigens]|uniref:4Fe-4S ferredoxin iron-sulfur binding domain protein n=1 Tax=Maridesulfovibrio salexigens (strain ATCC 14822 / DSM 2638 / NCIMB 8403 / VKM B-1763) TaxID=526222 RepID=C6BT01_MARSD|nr:4Fe-4S binding protein [Maridesulfovibrio salexigens]ACS79705.1 4Fe-4S ferredoxin iron-sulfur binding domain protein [Maridesulfovibrio salexigens DSM 2638]